MRIVFIVTKVGRGGAQRVSTVLAGYLQDQGHEVHILCYGANGSYPVKDGISVGQLPNSKDVLAKHIKRTKAFFAFCREKKIDLIISLFRGYDYTWLYRTLFPVKLILSQRNDPKAEYDGHLIPWLESQLYFRGADHVVFQTSEEMEYFGLRIRNKSEVIANPIMEGLPEPWEGPRRKEIVNFCRLSPQKNLKLLIDAFRELSLEAPGYRLKIYGNGAQREELKKYIEDQGLDGQAEILPFSPSIHQEIREAAMFVSSSDFEGISNSMLEAMALGLPCICTDCPAGGARMVIRNGENGILTPVGQVEPLKEAMLSLIKNPALGERLGKEAVKVRETYSAERICRQWYEMIQKVVGIK